jgi:hypothetical protein
MLTMQTSLVRYLVLIWIGFLPLFSWASPELDDLSSELKVMILRYLEPKDLAEVSRVSQSFAELSSDSWKAACKKQIVSHGSDEEECEFLEEKFQEFVSSLQDEVWTWRDLYHLIRVLQVTHEDLKDPRIRNLVQEKTSYFKKSLFHFEKALRWGLIYHLKIVPKDLHKRVRNTLAPAAALVVLIPWMFLVKSFEKDRAENWTDPRVIAFTSLLPVDLAIIGYGAAELCTGGRLRSLMNRFQENTEEWAEKFEEDQILQFKTAVIEAFSERFGSVPEILSYIQ